MELETDLDDAGFAEPEETTTGPRPGGSQSVRREGHSLVLPHSLPLFKMTGMNPLADLVFQPTNGPTVRQTERRRRQRELSHRLSGSSTGRRVNESGADADAAAREKAES